jgi:hypothetical protein
MNRLETFMLSAIIGSGLLVIGCGGSGDSGTASTAQPAAAPAEAAAPATPPAAATEPAAPATEPAATAGAGEPEKAAEGAQAATGERPRFVPPIRGTANIEILAPKTTIEGNEVVTRLKIRNASLGAIAMLRVDETWYDKAGNAMPGDTQRRRQLFMPGEIIDIELRVPRNSKFNSNNFQFSHANGKIDVKQVKSFPTPEGGGQD